jgi:hypothetical protein
MISIVIDNFLVFHSFLRYKDGFQLSVYSFQTKEVGKTVPCSDDF